MVLCKSHSVFVISEGEIYFTHLPLARDNFLFLFLQNSNNIGYHPLVITGTCYTPQFHQMFVHIV